MDDLHLAEAQSGGEGGGERVIIQQLEKNQQQLGTDYNKAIDINKKKKAVNRVCMPSPMAMTMSSTPAKQLTIFYDGTVSVYEAIPPEKVQAIMLIASATAASTVTGTAAGPVLGRCMSLRSSTSTAANVTTPQPQVAAFNSGANLFCQLQAELPMARRHSLQRFLQKRKDRLVTKAPYASAKPSDGMEEASKGSPRVA